jgi:hypothetical protein
VSQGTRVGLEPFTEVSTRLNSCIGLKSFENAAAAAAAAAAALGATVVRKRCCLRCYSYRRFCCCRRCCCCWRCFGAADVCAAVGASAAAATDSVTAVAVASFLREGQLKALKGKIQALRTTSRRQMEEEESRLLFCSSHCFSVCAHHSMVSKSPPLLQAKLSSTLERDIGQLQLSCNKMAEEVTQSTRGTGERASLDFVENRVAQSFPRVAVAR